MQFSMNVFRNPKKDMNIASKVNFSDDGFQKVTYKKKLKKPTPAIHPQNFFLTNSEVDEESAIRRISNAKTELATTDLFDSIKALISEGLSAIKDPAISKIICLGLGKFGECIIARYQFALLLCLKELFNVNVYIYDPIFNESDIRVLRQFGISIIEENLEGKYKVREDETVLFYLPHCPKQLTNNLLWVNWGLNLNNCIIVSNSFNRIVESCLMEELAESAGYISKITPYVLELAVINTFKYYEVFNDTSVHVFPKVNLISPDLWQFKLEPKYLTEDIEFITQDVNKLLI